MYRFVLSIKVFSLLTRNYNVSQITENQETSIMLSYVDRTVFTYNICDEYRYLVANYINVG